MDSSDVVIHPANDPDAPIAQVCSPLSPSVIPPEYPGNYSYLTLVGEVRVICVEGSADHSYQDAAAVGPVGFAIADGATISVCQKDWAQILVNRFVADGPQLNNEAARQKWWHQALDEWEAIVQPRIPIWRSEPTKYWTTLRNYQKNGASATFLGVSVSPVTENEFKYILYAVGDCYAFWVSQGQEPRIEPALDIERPKFDFRPPLLTSRAPFPIEYLRISEGTVMAGDMLLLMTDALAKYFVTETLWRSNPRVWEWLWAHDVASFGKWASELKANETIDKDDYTLLMIKFAAESGSMILTQSV